MSTREEAAEQRDFITFGPVHLDATDGDRALAFWRDVLGLELLEERDGALVLGAGADPLVVLRPVATRPVLRGFSGLYHLAVHLPDEPEFARVLARLIALRYPIAPTDHTMSKAIYLDDPDGIGLELTLETPGRLREWRVDDAGFLAVDAEGRRRSGRDPLDVPEVLRTLSDRDYMRPLPGGTTVGHVHLHVSDLEAAHAFYRDALGFLEHTNAPAIGMADLHAGGRFPHRLALNVWQGAGAPQPPPGTAGLRHFTLRFDSQARLDEATRRVGAVERRDDGRLTRDPAGNAVLLTA
jgi:catechol 2,3-dioxygenase